ncbi:MAG: hypothetical protein AB1697_11055 [Pseudomonadota bacterium]
MQRRFGRLVLLLFAWLQCLAPLLHAHAAEEHEPGVHLPALPLMLADAHTDEGWRNDQAPSHADHAIGVASSLEARQDGPPLDTPGLAGRRSPALNPAWQMGWQWPPAGSAPLPLSYLFPDACAPPRA